MQQIPADPNRDNRSHLAATGRSFLTGNEARS